MEMWVGLYLFALKSGGEPIDAESGERDSLVSASTDWRLRRMTTSLEGLCKTEEQRQIAKTLSERGILTDGDLILTDTASLSKISSLSQQVCSEIVPY